MRLTASLSALAWLATWTHAGPVPTLSGSAIIQEILATPDDAADGYTPYIYGGVDVVTPLSWAGTLQAVDVLGNYRHICGGALVAPNWAVTAAHCIGFISRACFGGVDRSNLASFQCFDVLQTVTYPEYNASRDDLWGDMALVRLSGASTLQPLAINGDPAYDAPGMPGTVVGWGETAMGVLPNALQAHNMTITANSECSLYYSAPNGPLEFPVSDTRLCETPVSNQSACHGDSGGPLYTTSSTGIQLLLGIVSFGECGDVAHPIVYTRARAYHDWLLTTMASTPDPTEGWGEWSSWGVCSQLCGGGNQTRARACNLPTGCVGNSTDVQPCNMQSCGIFSIEPTALTGITTAFNTRRCLHGAPRLTWNASLAANAYNTAMDMAGKGCILTLNSTASLVPPNANMLLDVERAWYDDIASTFDYASTIPLQGRGLRFATVIWKTASQIGCTAVQCPQNGMALVLCMVDNGPPVLGAPALEKANLVPPAYTPTQCGIPG